MQLYLDFGNSRAKWAIASLNADAGSWHTHGTFTYNTARTTQQTTEIIKALPEQAITNIWCANVANEVLISGWLQQLNEHLGSLPIHFAVTTKQFNNLRNAYRVPEKLGIDRWLAALAAQHHYPQTDLLVATMGTATTIDVISAQGLFLGGWILPGLTTMLTSLENAAWQLPALETPQTPIDTLYAPSGEYNQNLRPALSGTTSQSSNRLEVADNTHDAMRWGCLASQAGAITYCREKILSTTDKTPICLLSGGASKEFDNWLDFPVHRVENLVLQGLQLYAQETTLGKNSYLSRKID